MVLWNRPPETRLRVSNPQRLVPGEIIVQNTDQLPTNYSSKYRRGVSNNIIPFIILFSS